MPCFVEHLFCHFLHIKYVLHNYILQNCLDKITTSINATIILLKGLEGEKEAKGRKEKQEGKRTSDPKVVSSNPRVCSLSASVPLDRIMISGVVCPCWMPWHVKDS